MRMKRRTVSGHLFPVREKGARTHSWGGGRGIAGFHCCFADAQMQAGPSNFLHHLLGRGGGEAIRKESLQLVSMLLQSGGDTRGKGEKRGCVGGSQSEAIT